MNQKKCALYVEGQTEQILINHLIKVWWNYSDIAIENIKTLGPNRCQVPDYPNGAPANFFLIIDVGGEGSLPSSIAKRAKSQFNQGYTIIGLRDLYANDYEKEAPIHGKTTEQVILQRIKKAIKVVNHEAPDEIDIFFAIMEIEAWLLAFSHALQKWGKRADFDIPFDLESIRRPSLKIEQIGKAAGRENTKSLHEISSFVSSITREEIADIFQSNRIPSFSRFWTKILSISHLPSQLVGTELNSPQGALP
jgi:uncharacterized protein DUF4276